MTANCECAKCLATNDNPEGINQYTKGGSASLAKQANKLSASAKTKAEHTKAGYAHHEAMRSYALDGNFDKAKEHHTKADEHFVKGSKVRVTANIDEEDIEDCDDECEGDEVCLEECLEELVGNLATNDGNFVSEDQRKFLWSQHPDIAQSWAHGEHTSDKNHKMPDEPGDDVKGPMADKARREADEDYAKNQDDEASSGSTTGTETEGLTATTPKTATPKQPKAPKPKKVAMPKAAAAGSAEAASRMQEQLGRIAPAMNEETNPMTRKESIWNRLGRALGVVNSKKGDGEVERCPDCGAKMQRGTCPMCGFTENAVTPKHPVTGRFDNSPSGGAARGYHDTAQARDTQTGHQRDFEEPEDELHEDDSAAELVGPEDRKNYRGTDVDTLSSTPPDATAQDDYDLPQIGRKNEGSPTQKVAVVGNGLSDLEALLNSNPEGHNQYTGGSGSHKRSGDTIGKTSSGKEIHGEKHDVYEKGEKRPKWNVPVSPKRDASEGGKILKQRLPEYSKQDHLDAAKAHRDEADKKDKEWSKTRDEAHQETFGKKAEFHDYKVSGVGREEYSDEKKDKLRDLAHGSSGHKMAAEAHEAAAKLRGLTKNAELADLEKVLNCDMKENDMGPMMPGQPPDPHSASMQAASATQATKHAPAFGPAHDAVGASAGDDSTGAAKAHVGAAKAHEKEATNIRKNGDQDGDDDAHQDAADHDQAAALHRKAASMHAAQAATQNAAKAGKCPECGGDVKDGKCEECGYTENSARNNPLERIMSTMTPQERAAKLKALRPRVIAMLTANCKCAEDKAAFNAMSDELLARILMNEKAEGSNADVIGERGKTVQAGGEEEHPDDEEPFYRSEDEFTGKVKIKKEGLSTNSKFGDFVRQHGSPEDVATWNRVQEAAAADKARLVKQLIANVDESEKKVQARWLLSKSFPELQRMVKLLPPAQPHVYNARQETVTANAEEDRMMLAVFGGLEAPSGSGDFSTNAAVDDDILDVPHISQDEWKAISAENSGRRIAAG